MRHHSSFRHGMTLLEVTIAGTISAGLFYTVSQSMYSGTRVVDELTTASTSTMDVTRTLNYLARNFRSADRRDLWTVIDGDTQEWWYRTCAGFDLAGNGTPLYNAHRLIYDPRSAMLTEEVSTFDGDSYTLTLASEVTPQGFVIGDSMNAESAETLEGNRLEIRLSIDAETATGEYRPISASRFVFLRSYLYNSDGIGGAGRGKVDGHAGDQNGIDLVDDPAAQEPVGEQPVAEEPTGGLSEGEQLAALEAQAPEDINQAGGPDIVWGNNTASGVNNFEIIVTLNVGTHWTLDTGAVAIGFIGDNYSGMQILKGWEGAANLRADEIKISGTASGYLGITIYAEADGNKSKGKGANIGQTAVTRETNFY